LEIVYRSFGADKLERVVDSNFLSSHCNLSLKFADGVDVPFLLRRVGLLHGQVAFLSCPSKAFGDCIPGSLASGKAVDFIHLAIFILKFVACAAINMGFRCLRVGYIIFKNSKNGTCIINTYIQIIGNKRLI